MKLNKIIELIKINKIVAAGIVGTVVVASGVAVGVQKHNATVNNNKLAQNKTIESSKQTSDSDKTKAEEVKKEESSSQAAQSGDTAKDANKDSTTTTTSQSSDGNAAKTTASSTTNSNEATKPSSTSATQPTQQVTKPQPSTQPQAPAQQPSNTAPAQPTQQPASTPAPAAQPTYKPYAGFTYDLSDSMALYVGGENTYTTWYPELPNSSTVKFSDLNKIAQWVSMGAKPDKVKAQLVGRIYNGKYLITDFYVNSTYSGTNRGPNGEIWGRFDVYKSLQPELISNPGGLFAGAVCDYELANEQGIIRFSKFIIKFKEI